MSSPHKIPTEKRYEIYQRFIAGERKSAIAKVYDVNESTVRRIIKQFAAQEELCVVKTDESVDLEAQYIPEQTYKLKIRVPAVTKPLTQATVQVDALTEKPREREQGQIATLREQPGNTSMPVSISPLGVQLEPYHIYRAKGTLKHATADGSIVVLNTDGRAVAVERCPVYNEKWSMVCYRRVRILSSDGKDIRAEVQQWDGETIPGSLVIWGVNGNDGATVTRVEFHPDKMPESYIRSEEEIKERVS